MKIKRITLYNFGSYEGLNVIDTSTSDGANIILFGGENGAGKTTLFSSIGLCLYGYRSMGYTSFCSKYNKEITKYLNNKAKLNNDGNCYVELTVDLEHNQYLETYQIRRSWKIDKDVKEDFHVTKNGLALNKEQIADFEKYILALIPTSLFDLYFFDGEKIKEFLADNGSGKLKEAFLTLYGYDTFEIMESNFHRLVSNSKNEDVEYNKYSILKNEVDELTERIENTKAQININNDRLKDLELELSILDKEFERSGNVTEQEWQEKNNELRLEEKKRDEINSQVKKWANDVIPFLILRNNLISVKKRIINENQIDQSDSFISFLDSNEVKEYLSKVENGNDLLNGLSKLAKDKKSRLGNKTLNLSYEQAANVVSTIEQTLSFDKEEIILLKGKLDKSLKKSARIHKELDKLTADNSDSFISKKNDLLNEKMLLINQNMDLSIKLSELNKEYEEILPELQNCKKVLEKNIKGKSIEDISMRSILMLDQLKKTLYKNQIEKLRKNIKINIKNMMNKDDLISDVEIDDDFNIRIFQNKEISVKELKKLIDNEEFITNNILLEKNISKLKKICEKGDGPELTNVSIEINFDRLSAGEKQMFVMILYLSLVQLSNINVPFVIDTPFARIDKKHRSKVSEYFFKCLNGQIFILSTNREIDTDNIRIIRDNISKVYTLENIKNSKTNIIENEYFGENI